MAINFSPKVGEVLMCDYGLFRDEMPISEFDYRLPPEMIKKRLVVVLNGKQGGGCIVVPISSKEDLGAVRSGLHIHLPHGFFNDIDFAEPKDSWVKSNLVGFVSKKRLFPLTKSKAKEKKYLDRELVTAIQKGVVKSISAKALLVD